MAPLRALLSYLLPCALCAAAGSQTPEPRLSGKLSDYAVTVPCSTDFQGRFLSHVVSGSAEASAGSVVVDRTPIPPLHSRHLRVARSPLSPDRGTLPPGEAQRYFLYFNVTVFGKELHLRLRPNRRLVVPGASVEWQEDFQELLRHPLQQECVYTGGVTGMPGAAVAISNCDGLMDRAQQALSCLSHSSSWVCRGQDLGAEAKWSSQITTSCWWRHSLLVFLASFDLF